MRPDLLHACPPALRWAIGFVMASATVVAPPPGLALIAAVELGAYAAAGLRPRDLWRDLRFLLLHVPFLIVGTLIVGRIPGWDTVLISARIILAGLPMLWIPRVVKPTEMVRIAAFCLPLRMRLLLFFAVRLLPHLIEEVRAIRLVQVLSGSLPVRLRDWRVRDTGAILVTLSVPVVVRMVKATDDMADAIEGRGLDRV